MNIEFEDEMFDTCYTNTDDESNSQSKTFDH